MRLRVQRVLPKLGVAGFWSGDETASDNIFVAPGTIAGMLARGHRAVARAPPQSIVLVSNRAVSKPARRAPTR